MASCGKRGSQDRVGGKVKKIVEKLRQEAKRTKEFCWTAEDAYYAVANMAECGELIPPPPPTTEVYEKILALWGKESLTRPGSTVWVPAVANGGLELLLKELEKRGWRIYPPDDRPES